MRTHDRNYAKLTLKNIPELILNPAIGQKMADLVEYAGRVPCDVLLSPEGTSFRLAKSGAHGSDGVDFPLKGAEIDRAHNVLGSLMIQDFVGERKVFGASRVQKRPVGPELEKRKERTFADTMKYLAKAEAFVDYSEGALERLQFKMSAIHGRLYADRQNPSCVYCVTQLQEFPFDPRLEPHRISYLSGDAWAFDLSRPKSWRVLVALVMYCEDRAKANQTNCKGGGKI